MMDRRLQQKAMRLSTIDGSFAGVMGALTGGVFLTGFALNVLHAQPQQIGILAALPTLANLSQLLGAYLIERTGQRKFLCVLCSFLNKVLWLAIAMLPLAIFAPLTDWRVWILIIVLALSSLFASLGGVAWMAWMSDVVPEDIRGAYFGKRNMITTACATVAVLAGGKFLTMWEQRFSAGNPYGFVILFVAGLTAGVVSAWFLSRVPDVKSPQAQNTPFHVAQFLQPLTDKNFLTLTLFVAGWTFAMQLAAPFYGVFMIERLQADFSTMTLFTTCATLATVVMMKIWGPIADTLGNKPIILVSSGALIVVPFFWLMALPTHYALPLAAAHLLSGAFMAGASLSQFNILIKLSPPAGRAIYMAIFAAVVGLVGGVAPMVGGSLSQSLQGFRATLFTYQLTNLHLIFLLSALLQALVIFFVLKLQESGAAAPMAVIMQLRNDLDPQDGILSAMDFATVELERTEGILRTIDRVTDELAEKSESRMAHLLDTLAKPLKRVWDFLQRND